LSSEGLARHAHKWQIVLADWLQRHPLGHAPATRPAVVVQNDQICALDDSSRAARDRRSDFLPEGFTAIVGKVETA
jgi:hypothetical protein